MDSIPAQKQRQRVSAWRVLGLCAGGVSTLLVLVVIALGALIWRLSSGPLRFDQIARVAEQTLAHSLGGVGEAKIDSSELDWSWDHYGLIIRLKGVAAKTVDGGFAMTVPAAEIELKTLPILWGAVKPAALDLDSPDIDVDLTKLNPATIAAISAGEAPAVGQGTVPDAATAVQPAPSALPSQGTADQRPKIIHIIEQSIRGLADSLDATYAQGFLAINVESGSIRVSRPTPQGGVARVTVPAIEIEGAFNKTGDVDLSFSARGDVGRWGMRLRETHGSDGHSRHLLFEGNDATARDLIGQLPPDVILDIPVYPTIDAVLDGGGTLSTFKVDLRLGAGQFHFGKYPEDEMLIDEGDIAAHWDRSSNAFIVDQAGASTGTTTVSVKGRIAPPGPTTTGDASHIWSYDLGLDRAVLQPRDAGGDPLPVDYLRIAGTIDAARRLLNLDDINARFGGGEIKGGGAIDFARDKPQIMVNFQLSPVDWSVVRRAWPAFIASGARNWFLKQVTGGRVSEGIIKLDLPMFTEPQFLPSTSIAFSGRIQGGSFHTFGDLPDAIGIDGHFSSANRQFEAVGEKGQGATRYPKKPDIIDMRLVIPDSFQRSPKGHIEFHLIGENGAIGEIANAEPLVILDDAGIKLDGIQGSADVHGIMDMILEDNPKPDQIDFRVDATLDRFGSPSPILGKKFADANVKIVADPKGTAVTGKARIDGVVTDVNVYEPRVKTKTNERRDFKLTLDEAARQRMGLDLSQVLSGPIQLAITQSPGGNERARHIDADLTSARLTLSAFGWTKGAGVPAKASIDMSDDDKGTHLDNIVIEAEGVQIRGKVDLDKDHRPLVAELSKFSLHKGDDAKIHIQRQPDQSVAGTFEAASFDMRGLIQTLKHSSDTADPEKSRLPDIQIKAKLARVIGYNDLTLSDAVLEATLHQGIVTKLSLSGQMPGGRAIAVQIRPNGANRQLALNCDDAGAFLGFIDIYDHMQGGSIDLKTSLSAPGVAEGNLRLIGFHLKQQSKAEEESNVAADGTRTLQIRQATPTTETDFDKFAANFALRKGVITMTQGIAKGPSTGATASGQIDLNNQRIQIKGTYIPLYGINNLVSRIPLLGEIAGAGRNEGLLGVTFKVVGSVDDPVLQVNPISAIAPGIFRRIFEYHVDEAHGGDDSEKTSTSN